MHLSVDQLVLRLWDRLPILQCQTKRPLLDWQICHSKHPLLDQLLHATACLWHYLPGAWSATFETNCQSCQTKCPLLDWQIYSILPGKARPLLDQLLHATACVWQHLAFEQIRKPFLIYRKKNCTHVLADGSSGQRPRPATILLDIVLLYRYMPATCDKQA